MAEPTTKTALRAIFEDSLVPTSAPPFSFASAGLAESGQPEDAQPAAPSAPAEPIKLRKLCDVYLAASKMLDEFNGAEPLGAKFCKSEAFLQHWDETRDSIRQDCKRLKREVERRHLGGKRAGQKRPKPSED
jgi:hypothetical protein